MSQPRGDIRVGDPVQALRWGLSLERVMPDSGQVSYVGRSRLTREPWVTVTFNDGARRDYIGAGFIRTDITRLPRE